MSDDERISHTTRRTEVDADQLARGERARELARELRVIQQRELAKERGGSDGENSEDEPAVPANVTPIAHGVNLQLKALLEKIEQKATPATGSSTLEVLSAFVALEATAVEIAGRLLPKGTPHELVLMAAEKIAKYLRRRVGLGETPPP